MDTCPEGEYVLMTNGSVTTAAKLTRGPDGHEYYDVDGAGGYECDYDFNVDPPSYWMPRPLAPEDAAALSKKIAESRWFVGPCRPGLATPALDFLEYLRPDTALSKFRA